MGLELVLGECPVCPAVGSPVSPLFNQQQKGSRMRGFVAGHHVGCAKESLFAKKSLSHKMLLHQWKGRGSAPWGDAVSPWGDRNPCIWLCQAHHIYIFIPTQAEQGREVTLISISSSSATTDAMPCASRAASQWQSMGYNFLAIMTNLTPSKCRIME